MAWTKVEFLETGDAYYEALLRELASARKTVLVEKYIFRMDRIGRRILDALGDCERRGVQVYLRVDGLGSRQDLRAIAENCHQNGVDAEVFHPLPFAPPGPYHPAGFAPADSFWVRWSAINRRSHRKLVIVDETVAFTGGRNVDEVQSETFSGRAAWHDLSLRLEGPPVQDLVNAFWFKPVPLFYAKSNRDLLLNHTWRLRQSRTKWFSRRVRRARERVWIVTPYFAPTPLMMYQVRAAARRGIDVRVILSRKTDVMISRLAAIGLYRKLLKWGVKVYEFEPSLLHRKLWIVDNLAVVGSGNFNHRSFVHDLELDVILRDRAQVAKAAEICGRDQARSALIDLEHLKGESLGMRMLSWVASWFTYWL